MVRSNKRSSAQCKGPLVLLGWHCVLMPLLRGLVKCRQTWQGVLC